MDNIYKDIRTSLIPLVSTLHSEQRRRERDIEKRDLQAAIKHGKKELTYGEGGLRYKITYGGLVYITDSTCTVEISCWPLPTPLLEAPIDDNTYRQEVEQKSRVSSGRMRITSHTVLIVDQSGSMRTGDIDGHRTRSSAVYYNIAEEIIAAPLLRGQPCYTDVVTLIEMSRDAVIHPLIFKEPISWSLYNRVVELSNDEFRAKYDGNYLPALQKAHDVLVDSDAPYCAPMLFFLSDGRPSDAWKYGMRPSRSDHDEVDENIRAKLSAICRHFGARLTFGCLGFAGGVSDFETLQKMVNTAKALGVQASFRNSRDSSGLRAMLSTLTSSMTLTRTGLSSMLPMPSSHSSRVRRPGLIKDDKKSAAFDASEWEYFDVRTHFVERQALKKGTSARILKGKLKVSSYEKVPFFEKNAMGIAIKKRYLGEGAERIVYEMTEVDAYRNHIGSPLVVKINKFVEDGGYDELEFHTLFGLTQKVASRLANKFNQKLDLIKAPDEVPRIKYLDCTYYTAWKDDYERGWLVEKQLDTKTFQKWSDNGGGITNRTQGDVNRMDEVIRMLENVSLDAIAEGDEEDEDEEDYAKVVSAPLVSTARAAWSDDVNRRRFTKVLPEDVLLAFSHYTYVYSQRDILVCDLQGVLTHSSPMCFELTDPAIHSKETGQFGRTDHGRKGMNLFFNTHKCNPLCEILGLDRR